jgi:hypothetical protein
MHSVSRIKQRKNKMKKIMIMAVAAIMAVSANAAMVDWTVARQAWGAEGGAAFEGASGGTIYAFLADDSTAVQAILSATTVGDTLDFSSIAVSEKTTTNSRGAASGMLQGDSIAAGSEYGIFFVALNADSTKYLVSNTMTGKAYDASSAATSVPAAWAADAIVTGTWADFKAKEEEEPVVPGPGGNVPEPTSGLLMLIGAAGLALRRKNA